MGLVKKTTKLDSVCRVRRLFTSFPSTLIIFSVATSPEAFLKAVENKELFGSIVDATQPCRIGGFDQYFTVAISDPAKALAGPVTEVASA